MATSYSQNLTLPSPAVGDSGWGPIENTARTLVDSAVAGVLQYPVWGSGSGGSTGAYVLSYAQGAADQERNQHFTLTSSSGALTAPALVLFPNGLTKTFSVQNSSTGSSGGVAYAVTIGVNNGSSTAAGATIAVPQGYTMNLFTDGTGVFNRQSAFTGSVTATSLTVSGSISGLYVPGLLYGAQLSNDVTNPNTVLDISAGYATDASLSTLITLPAVYFKSVGSAWAAGTGSSGVPVPGMGAGLTAASGTWYHVHAILNSGAPDVYFDTSVTAANAPSGTTNYRRLGSMKTAASSANILAYVQDGDYFRWSVSNLEFNITNPGTNSDIIGLAWVPPGVTTQAILSTYLSQSDANANSVYLYDYATSHEAIGQANIQLNMDGPQAMAWGGNIRASNTGVIGGRVQFSNGNTVWRLQTYGWFDTRGRT